MPRRARLHTQAARLGAGVTLTGATWLFLTPQATQLPRVPFAAARRRREDAYVSAPQAQRQPRFLRQQQQQQQQQPPPGLPQRMQQNADSTSDSLALISPTPRSLDRDFLDPAEQRSLHRVLYNDSDNEVFVEQHSGLPDSAVASRASLRSRGRLAASDVHSRTSDAGPAAATSAIPSTSSSSASLFRSQALTAAPRRRPGERRVRSQPQPTTSTTGRDPRAGRAMRSREGSQSSMLGGDGAGDHSTLARSASRRSDASTARRGATQPRLLHQLNRRHAPSAPPSIPSSTSNASLVSTLSDTYHAALQMTQDDLVHDLDDLETQQEESPLQNPVYQISRRTGVVDARGVVPPELLHRHGYRKPARARVPSSLPPLNRHHTTPIEARRRDARSYGAWFVPAAHWASEPDAAPESHVSGSDTSPAHDVASSVEVQHRARDQAYASELHTLIESELRNLYSGKAYRAYLDRHGIRQPHFLARARDAARPGTAAPLQRRTSYAALQRNASILSRRQSQVPGHAALAGAEKIDALASKVQLLHQWSSSRKDHFSAAPDAEQRDVEAMLTSAMSTARQVM